jgi:hypothetical protein
MGADHEVADIREDRREPAKTDRRDQGKMGRQREGSGRGRSSRSRVFDAGNGNAERHEAE